MIPGKIQTGEVYADVFGSITFANIWSNASKRRHGRTWVLVQNTHASKLVTSGGVRKIVVAQRRSAESPTGVGRSDMGRSCTLRPSLGR